MLWLPLSSTFAHDVPFIGTRVIGNVPGAQSVGAADFDGDGDLDILGSSTGAVGVLWVQNVNGDGSSWNRVDIDSTLDLVFDADAGDIDGDGDIDVVAISNTENDVAWFENDGSGGTWTRNDINLTFGGASSVQLVDIDGDGDLDALATAAVDDDVAWFENDGSGGTWTERTIDGSYDGAVDALAADVDLDGDIDVFATRGNAGVVTWWENTNGIGTTWTERTIASFANGTALAVADFDGDGDPDVAAASEDNDIVNWYRNNDALTWSLETIDPSFDGAFDLFAADVDGDGDQDLAGAARNDNDIVWWENVLDETRGATNWNKYFAAAAFTNARGVYVADLDSDGDMDILGTSTNIQEISWWESQDLHRSATFPEETLVAGSLSGSPCSPDPACLMPMDSADFDADGDLDIVTVAETDGSVSIWENAGDGVTYIEDPITSTLTAPIAVQAGDIDRDGDMDFMASSANARIHWWENDNDGASWTENTIAITFDGLTALVDVDGDGDLDVVGADDTDNDIVWFENDGSGGTWTENTVDGDYDPARSVFGADLDGDGDIDIIGARNPPAAGFVDWWENLNGSGTSWSAAQSVSTDYEGAAFVSTADMDGDGDLDILAAAEGADVISWFENPSWTERQIGTGIRPYNQALHVVAADFDRDGDLDAAGTQFKDGGKVSWQENVNGSATSWTEHILTDAFDGANYLEVADLNNDGAPDIAATASTDDDFSVWINRGGQFALITTDLAGGALGDSITKAILSIEVVHNGRSGDPDLEIADFELLFEQSVGVPLTDTRANGIIDTLFVYRDSDSSGDFDLGLDTLVLTVNDLTLASGVETLVFADEDPNVQVSFGSPELYFVVVQTAADYSSQPLASFLVTHVTEASSTAQQDHPRTGRPDVDLDLEFVANTGTSAIAVNASPPGADLGITKADNVDPVAAGNNVAYTIQVSNAGPDDATDVVVTDNLPNGLTLVSTSGCAEDPNGAPTCTLGTIASGNNASFVLTASVDGGASGVLSNTASVSAAVADNNSGNDSATETTTVIGGADLQLLKSDSADPTTVNSALNYTLIINNLGPSDATNVVVSDTLPSDVTLVSTTGCAEDPNGIPTCTLGNLAASSGTAVIVATTVNSDAGVTLSNTATASATEPDGVPGNNGDTETTTVSDGSASADLGITKTASATGHVVGQPITYTIDVTNGGPDAANAIPVTDTFPIQLTGVSWTCSTLSGGGVCGNPSGNGSINETVDLPANSSVRFIASGTLNSDVPSVTNTASISVPPGVTDTSAGNNSDSATTLDAFIFEDGFESGDTCQWPVATEGCP